MGSRRDFLKGVLAGGAAATACVASTPAVARETRPRPPEAMGLLYDSTLCVGCKACVAACKTANDNPAEFLHARPPVGHAARYLGLHLQPDQDVPQRHHGCQGSGNQRLRLHEDVLHALRRPVLRFGLPGLGDDQGSGDRRRWLQPGQMHRLPLLRRGLPVRHPQIPVRLAHRPHRQVRAVPPSPQGRPLLGLRRGLPDRSDLVRSHRGLAGRSQTPAWRTSQASR
jgi:ferredoxin